MRQRLERGNIKPACGSCGKKGKEAGVRLTSQGYRCKTCPVFG